MPKASKTSIPGLDIMGLLTALKPFAGKSGQGMIDRALEMTQAVVAALGSEGVLTGLTGQTEAEGLPSNVRSMLEDVKQAKAQGMSFQEVLEKYKIDPSMVPKVAALLGGLRGLGGLGGLGRLRGLGGLRQPGPTPREHERSEESAGKREQEGQAEATSAGGVEASGSEAYAPRRQRPSPPRRRRSGPRKARQEQAVEAPPAATRRRRASPPAENAATETQATEDK